MKKSILTLGVVIAALTTVNAQSVNNSKVPAGVKSSFAKSFPEAKKVKWEIEKGNYEAGYYQNGLEMAALYTPSGKMIESEAGIKVSDLPTYVTDYLNKNLKGKKVEEAAKITKSNGEINYEAVVAKKAYVFNSSGKLLQVTKD